MSFQFQFTVPVTVCSREADWFGSRERELPVTGNW